MRVRPWLLAALLAGCSAGGSGSGVDPAVPPPPTFTERCHTSQLRARLESEAAGVAVFSLTDTADVACVLEGYARVELVDPTGTAGPQPTRVSDAPVRRLTLAPGKAASFELHTRSTATGAAGCTPVNVARVLITAPDETDPLTVEAGGPNSLAGCEGQYGVTAMHAGP
jgi:hypothetical protein